MRLTSAQHHELLDLGDRFGWIEALGAGLGAVHNGVTAVEAKRVLKRIESLAGCLVPAVGDPPVGLEQDGGAEISIGVPPIARTARGAAEAQNAVLQTVESGAALGALQPLPLGCGGDCLEPVPSIYSFRRRNP